MSKFLNCSLKTSIYLLVFLLPLFFLPFSFEAFEFNKQYLLVFLASLSFFFWLAKMVLVDKEIKFKRTPLDIPVFFFLFIAILSAVFSVDKISSLFGFYGRFSDGLIGLISLGLLYFLITNNVTVPLKHADLNAEKTLKSAANQRSNQRQISVKSLIRTLLWSFFFVILFSYFSIFGVWLKLNNLMVQKFQGLSLPPVMLQSTFNPVSGSMEGLSMFLAVVVVFLVGRLLTSDVKNKFSLVIHYLLLIASLGLLLIIDFGASWIVLLVSLVLFVSLALAKRMFRENVNKLLLPIFLIVIAIIGLSTNVTRNVLLALPQEQVLAQGTSWQIAGKTAIDNIKNGFLGSGIGTYSFDFSEFKPVEFNQSALWQIRFDRPGSHLAEIIGTMGFLGILVYLVLVGLFLIISWFFFQGKREKLPAASSYQLPLFLAFLALLVSQFVYYQNTTLAFTFWLILALSVVSWQKPISEKTFSFKEFPELNLVFSVFLMLITLVIAGFYYFAIKFYLADINYKASLATANLQKIEKAVSLNPYQTQYRIVLARSYLGQALTEMAKPIAQQDSAFLQNNVAKAIAEAKVASEISPNSVTAWETLGMIYREIRLVASGALDWGIKSFARAIELEPTNPVLQTELGKLYLFREETSKARELFARAIELKSDYIDALLQDALISERENNLEEAIQKIENLVLNYPFNIEILFQLGRLYFNANRIDEAISQFEAIVSVLPNHSNALYSLALAYQKKGQKEKAISAFEKVLELNPGNPDVIQKLEELKK